MEICRVSFIGHRTLYNQRQIEIRIEEIIVKLIEEKEHVEIYVCRNGDFDILVASAIKRMQKEYGNHNSCLIVVFPYPMKDDEYYEKYYDEIVFPISYKIHFKRAIIGRNKWIVENSELLICYVETSSGGAYTCMEYAKKTIKNLADVSNFENKKDT